MRHRATRTFLGIPLRRPDRRGLVVAAALVATTALAGVAIALQDDAPAPSAASGPLAAGPELPGLTDDPTTTESPRATHRPSRDATRPSGTPSSSPEPSDTTLAVPEVTAPTPSQVARVTRPSTPSPTPPDDGSAPQTTARTSSTGSDSWTVSVAADETSTYQCSLDGGSFEACGTSVTYSDLDRGRHTFVARATDEAGNTDPTPAELDTTITGRS